MNDFARRERRRSQGSFQRAGDQLRGSFFPGAETGRSRRLVPRLDLVEGDEDYLLYVDLPGLTKEEIDITYQDGELSISGERKEEAREGQRFHRAERFFGRFHRAVSFQDVDVDGIEASFENGVLSVRIPKQKESKPQRIEVS